MLLDHEVDGLLRIVQVELVILRLPLLLRLLLILLVRVAQPLRLAPILHRDRRAKLHFRLLHLVLGPVEDLLLQLELLAHLPGLVGPRLIIPIPTLEEGERFRLLVLRRLWLRREVVQEHEGRVQLRLLVQSLVQEAHFLVIFFLELTLDALVLYELEFLFLL